MKKDDLIDALTDSLESMINWAMEVSDEYLDGEEGTRRQFALDLKRARELLIEIPE
jgi:hypothetical protein